MAEYIDDIIFAKLVALGYATSPNGDTTTMIAAWKAANSVTSWSDYQALVFATVGANPEYGWADYEWAFWNTLGVTASFMLLEDGTSRLLLESADKIVL